MLQENTDLSVRINIASLIPALPMHSFSLKGSPYIAVRREIVLPGPGRRSSLVRKKHLLGFHLFQLIAI